MKINIQLIVLTLGFIVSSGCEQDQNGPISNDSVAPGKIKEAIVTNIAGGAIIKYTPPSDEDLLYVEAKYKLKNGNEFKVRSSVYSDTLIVQGFGDTSTYDINIYSVDRSENISEPVLVKVDPLTPPITNIFQTINLRKTFGGVNITWENENSDAIAIILSASNKIDGPDGPLEVIETFYSDAPSGRQSVRGFDTDAYRFRAKIRDRWGNFSDYKDVVINPYFESKLDKGLFREVILPGDTKQTEPWNPNGGSTITKLWDENTDERLVGFNGDMPDNYYYTFDLGIEVSLSRMKFWQFTQGDGEYLYFDAQYRKFEIWGASELDVSGSWAGWTKLKDCEIVKPSGLAEGLGSYTNEDKEIAFAGHDFEFGLDIPRVRYIRIKVNSSFSGLDWGACGEMTFWGDIN
tara:strand:- start:10272 stop:11486 length:1215 start_codon:yes stop_codon:yes gene_type:complete